MRRRRGSGGKGGVEEKKRTGGGVGGELRKSRREEGGGGAADLVVLDLTAHHPEGVVAAVVVDVDPAEASGATGRNPLPVGVVVNHDGGPGLADTLLTAEGTHRHTHTNILLKKTLCEQVKEASLYSIKEKSNRVLQQGNTVEHVHT